MCGIVGILDYDKKNRSISIQEMAAPLRHRGPDDRGEWTNGVLSFGFCRLSILDKSPAGHQPMTTPDGKFVLTFNGEIYNYRELKQKYLADSKLQSTSDTEVLLHLLAQHKEKIIPDLRGMFAFALWDEEKSELLLARDAFGKKPLYYTEQENFFSFASEPKALLSDPQIKRDIDEVALATYFLFEYVPSPRSGWKDIQQLPMGHWMKINKQRTEIKSWWQPQFLPKQKLSEAKALEKLDQLLGQAVQRRMIADVPVGVFLSGGLDSTTIAWYMRQNSPSTLHSFSISFDEASFNEGSFAKQAAQFLGTNHHDTLFDLTAFHKTITELVPQMDIPLADASLLPMYLLSKEARQYITVALDGDGSDELFAGYGTFQAAELADKLEWLPKEIIFLFNYAAEFLPTNYEYFSWDFKLRSFLKGLSYSASRRNQIWLSAFSDSELKQLFTPTWQKNTKMIFNDLDELMKKNRNLSTLDATSLLTIHYYLSNDILVKLDRATMFNSIEARTPFLDTDLVKFVIKLPEKFKRKKYLLKKLMYGRIPQEILDRPKKGFGIPLGLWLKGPLYKWAQKILVQKKMEEDGILEPLIVQKLLNEHHAGKFDHRKKLWTLIIFQLWWDKWVTGVS